jgi:hypothetical protein
MILIVPRAALEPESRLDLVSGLKRRNNCGIDSKIIRDAAAPDCFKRRPQANRVLAQRPRHSM